MIGNKGLIKKNKIRFKELDCFRGIAALFVMLFHYSRDFELFFGFIPLQYGYLGVQLFFMISGFVIFMTLEKTTHYKDFIVSRFSRLYPTYWANVILTFLFINYFNIIPVKFTATQLLGNLTMFQHWMLIKNIDSVYWTLSVELNFYILIFITFLINRIKNIEKIGVGFLLIMLAVHYIKKFIDLPFYYVMPLLHWGHLFFAGIIFFKLKSMKANNYYHILILFSMLVQVLLNSNKLAENIIILAFYGLFYLFIYNKMNFINNRILIFLGSISYSLYLFHQINGFIFYKMIDFIHSEYIKYILVCIFSVTMASLISYFIERPMLRYIRSFNNKRNKINFKKLNIK
ncbi:MAG: acyltransferase [Bacteroidales bacterium]|nr:acyltransferase [Bacteroidales bacterium]